MGNPEGGLVPWSVARYLGVLREGGSLGVEGRSKGQFLVKACYAHVANIEEVQGLWGLVWYNAVPLKV